MKRILCLLCALIWLLLPVAGCSQTAVVQATATPFAVDLKKEFELHLYTNKTTYSTNEQITIWATLKYAGDEKQIEIWHGDPYVSFFITDGNWFETGDLFYQTLSNTILEQGKLYAFNYQKIGGYDADRDPHAAFWKKFYAEKELYLPKGQYRVRVRGAFSLDKATPDTANNLADELDIIVR